MCGWPLQHFFKCRPWKQTTARQSILNKITIQQELKRKPLIWRKKKTKIWLFVPIKLETGVLRPVDLKKHFNINENFINFFIVLFLKINKKIIKSKYWIWHCFNELFLKKYAIATENIKWRCNIKYWIKKSNLGIAIRWQTKFKTPLEVNDR